jgi:dTDP-4-amino-4,6-dideoxygalactose transaminase
MSERTLATCWSSDTRAVIIVHLFGKAVDSVRIGELARERGVAVIEDVAQAIGGRLNGRPLGSFGDYAVLSFDEKKILSGGPGGALLVREANGSKEILEEAEAMPRDLTRSAYDSLGHEFNELTRQLFSVMRLNRLERLSPMSEEMVERYRPLFVLHLSGEDRSELVADSYARLEAERERRYRNYLRYATHLRPDTAYVRYRSEEMCWRLPVLLAKPEDQSALVAKVRAEGALISDHYFPVSCLLGDRSCPTAERIGLTAVNLWIDSKLDPRWVPWICDEINAIT